jgi:hypothetical protein
LLAGSLVRSAVSPSSVNGRSLHIDVAWRQSFVCLPREFRFQIRKEAAMKNWAACMVVLVTLLGAMPASAGPVLIEFKGTIVTGGIKGSIGGDVTGTALFPDDLTDQIKGGFEDWWETKGFAAFTFQGGGIDFKTSAGDYSSLRLKDGGIGGLEAEALRYPGEDALRYDGVQGSNSLSLLLSGAFDAVAAGGRLRDVFVPTPSTSGAR